MNKGKIYSLDDEFLKISCVKEYYFNMIQSQKNINL